MIFYMTEYVVDKDGCWYKWYPPLYQHIPLKKEYWPTSESQPQNDGNDFMSKPIKTKIADIVYTPIKANDEGYFSLLREIIDEQLLISIDNYAEMSSEFAKNERKHNVKHEIYQEEYFYNKFGFNYSGGADDNFKQEVRKARDRLCCLRELSLFIDKKIESMSSTKEKKPKD